MEVRSWIELFEGSLAESVAEGNGDRVPRGSVGIALCMGGVTVSAAVGVLVCSQTVALSEADAHMFIRVLAVALSIAWVALSVSVNHPDRWRFVRVFAVTLVTSGTIAATVLVLRSGDPRPFFWASLVIWLALAAIGVRRYAEDGLQGALLIAVAVWTVSGVVMGVGRSSILPFARAAIADVYGIHLFLDIRYISGAAVVVSAGALAVTRALRQPLPSPPPIRPLRLPSPSATLGPAGRALLEPFIAILNALLAMVREVVDVLYRATVIIAKTFLRIGAELAQVARELWLNRRAMAWLVTVIGSFLLLVGLYAVGISCTPHAYVYLRSTGWSLQLAELAGLAWRLILMLFCVLGLAWLGNGDRQGSITSRVYGMTALLGVMLLSGAVMYVLSRLQFLGIAGFGVPGPFTVSLLVVVAAGLGISHRMAKTGQL